MNYNNPQPVRTDKATPNFRPYHELFPTKVRLKLSVALLGSITVSLVETGSILMLLPLMDLVAGTHNATSITTTIDRILGHPSHQVLVIALVSIVLGGFVLKDLFTMIFRWWFMGFTNRQMVATATHILEYFLHAPYSIHLQRTMADMMRSVGDSVSQFYARSVAGTMSLISESVSIITIMGALIFLMPIQTVAMIAYFGIAGAIFIRVIKPRIELAGTRQLDAGKEMFEASIHSFGGIKEIKIRHAQPHFVDRYRRASLVNAQANRVAAFLGEAPKYLLEILFILGLGMVVLLTTGSGRTGVIGALAVLAAAAFRVLPSLTRLLTAATSIRSGEPARKILFAELAAEAANAPTAGRTPTTDLLPFSREIRFEHVSFTYSDATIPVLNDVSFVIPAGTSVALVGGSGSGKTTLANLLMGLHAPDSGRILVDGVDVAEHLDAWQNNISFVPQDVFHMDLPFDVNIAFDQYRQDVDPVRLQKALEQAQLLDLVASLPAGLDTTIGDRGVRLSGGQRQRIGIARALYREPRLLVLDEATSALDNETERRITETLTALHGDITMVIIAHRLSTVRDSDQIIMLDKGNVIATGTFHELAEQNDAFAHLVELGGLTDGAGDHETNLRGAVVQSATASD